MILRVSLYFDPQANRFTHQSIEVGEIVPECPEAASWALPQRVIPAGARQAINSTVVTSKSVSFLYESTLGLLTTSTILLR